MLWQAAGEKRFLGILYNSRLGIIAAEVCALWEKHAVCLKCFLSVVAHRLQVNTWANADGRLVQKEVVFRVFLLFCSWSVN